ncbi:MAG: hypothetical protein CMJ59_08160 [Planctomycetaceae bacterium]|nr:hypothetical protein [Planctomycetaceae bacterium]
MSLWPGAICVTLATAVAVGGSWKPLNTLPERGSLAMVCYAVADSLLACQTDLNQGTDDTDDGRVC